MYGALRRASFEDMANAGSYSELEYLILAMVGEGVSSGYSMRKEMNRMRGGRWSSESGSVYRVLRRLRTDGLVVEVRRTGMPKRERTEYELTGEGEALLFTWLTFPPEPAEMAFLVDPLRTRSYFLCRLNPVEQMLVVKSWIQESKSFLQDLQRDVNLVESRGISGAKAIAYQNLLQLGQARHEWLKKLHNAIRAQAESMNDVDEEALAGA
ncbi:MAG TPA: PadR family transcriptional regulator [Fimbriimonadaceae bacterium]|nr:PadR family transcriptional regulator [Fimbriimonadaceae bacterium]